MKYNNQNKAKKYIAILIFLAVIALLKIVFPQTENPSETPSQNSSAVSTAPENNATAAPHLPAEEYRVHVLDVGQGLAVFIQNNDQTLLYDGGEKSATAYVVSYLNHLGVTKLDYCISSHYDSDHLYGVVGAMNAFEIDTFIGADYITDSPAYNAFTEACENWNISVLHPQIGETFPFGSGNFQVFYSQTDEQEDENDYSLIVKLTLGETSLLLTGDASTHIEQKLLEMNYNFDSDVLVLGHHGSSDSTSEKFLETVSPEYAIISCGLFNDHGHPHWEIVELLEQEKISLYRTDLQDSILFTMSDENIVFEQQPCGDYSSGNDLVAMQEKVPADVAFDADTAGADMIFAGVDEFNSATFDPSEFTYILNTGGKKFHRIDCNGIYDMNAKNRQGTVKSREELINAGYKGCGTCNP